MAVHHRIRFMGGVYERMVGITKTCLRKVLSKVLIRVKAFETYLCECETIINTRPLVHVGADNEPFGVITPANFLTLNPNIGSINKPPQKMVNDLFKYETSTTT